MLFDSHAHLAPEPQSLENLLATMDRNGIGASVVIAGGAIAAGQPPPTRQRRYDNIALLKQCERASHRLFPFFFANPTLPIDSYRNIGSRFYGLKIGPLIHGVAFSSPLTVAYVEVAREFRHLVYAHCLDREGFRVADFVALARRFPSLNFVLGHGGIGHLDFAAVDLIAPYPRIFFETSGTFAAVVRYGCEKLGARRVLFGSEHPLQSSRAELEKMRDLRLPQTDLEAVLGQNIALLLKGARR